MEKIKSQITDVIVIYFLIGLIFKGTHTTQLSK